VEHVGDTRHVLRPLRLLRCQAGHTCRAGQVDEQLPLQLPPPHGERLFGVLALREVSSLIASISRFSTHQLKSTKISAFCEFNRYMAIFRKYFESERKCKCLIISALPFLLVPRLFARFESFSSECIIPLDFNEFLSVRYVFQLRCKVTHFSRKTCRMCYFFIVHPNV